MRQYLFHGLSSNHMELIVNFIPTFIHISLFLFFIGLAENLFATNRAVAITTITIISFCAACYIAFSVYPVFFPQTPFQTPLSNFIWRMGQIILPRKHCTRDTKGKMVPVSPVLADGLLQLAMGYSNSRMEHDTDTIHWITSKITEDSEFEPFAAGLAGSLATLRGRDIWERIFRGNPRNMPLIPYNAVLASKTVERLKIQIESLLRTVSTHSDQQTRFSCTCICIDAVASLTVGFSAVLEPDIDNDLLRSVLRFYGERSRRVQANQVMDTSIEIKWKCLMLRNTSLVCFRNMSRDCLNSIN
jgi:hypothetical protein